MEKLELKNNVIIWSETSYNWIINFKELTLIYLSGKHPYIQKELSTSTLNKILVILRQTNGNNWITFLKSIKNYKKIFLTELRIIKNSNNILGNGKHAIVYNYNNFAVKVIKHCNYKELPCIDGQVEAKVLNLLKKYITFNYKSPNIILMYQYTKDKTKDYIVLEKLEKTLWNYLQEKINNDIIIGIILQVVFTLAILQYTFPGFRHNDLKIDNILLDYTPRNTNITLQFNGLYWSIPPFIPIVKLADFDYCYIPKKCVNPKVGTVFSKTFGCTSYHSKIYDIHLFLNSIFIYRTNLSKKIINWLIEQIPSAVRGNDNIGIKYGRLTNVKDYEKIISTPEALLSNKLFSKFKTNNPINPIWGI